MAKTEEKNKSVGVRNGNGFAANGDISQAISEKKDWKYFWNRVIKDVTNRDLAPVKILFFFKYASKSCLQPKKYKNFNKLIFTALFVLYPFLTLHMAELGLDEYEIGINQATAPLIAILGPPFVGIIADKIGNFKVLVLKEFCILNKNPQGKLVQNIITSLLIILASFL
jgi:hypothetical protein